jgi:hypothetical protein
MGMDVYGENPKNEKGEYFRNNVWWWRPLADFVCSNYEEIAQHCEHWHSNDGDGLDAEKSQELGERILADVATGMVAEYEKSYNAYLATLERKNATFARAQVSEPMNSARNTVNPLKSYHPK